ncbi:2OG-Fe(II) oxygenase [Anatilimnocola floriformis]|uniref:2OG-Fe(II) oxygenase n=1 Tax=Anatilimnocola floriformis TaxID=2948575 RepID=UPI0020C5649B|nr:2OG-Fe(II) oxygenase [Anatilimnocola floriformis]
MKTELAENLFTVADLLSAVECDSLIARGEEIGFELASVRTHSGPQLRTNIRDNSRANFNDLSLADDLWQRCLPHVSEQLAWGTPVGLDPNFRFYRYDVGQRFRRHIDGFVEESPQVRSRLTCLFYLNDDFTGGETAFYADDKINGDRPEIVRVVPRKGSALFFRHEWWHEGRQLASGRKYVLRSDVFFRSK